MITVKTRPIKTKVMNTITTRNSEGWISIVTVYSTNTIDELRNFISTIHPDKKFVIQEVWDNVKRDLVDGTYDIYYPHRIITGPCVI